MEKKYKVIDCDCEPDVWFDNENILNYKDIENIIYNLQQENAELKSELEVYKRAFQKIGLYYFDKDLYRTAREQWINSWLDQARKELEDERK